jgi:hypothetical protein
MEEAMDVWEGEGGALRRTGGGMNAMERIKPRLVPEGLNPAAAKQKMIGTANQAEWAEQIKTKVNAEFKRVAKALELVAGKQTDQKRRETLGVIAILEEKWAEVMASDHAGYFIREWQELRDEVRRLLIQDPRYQEIKAKRVAQ